MTQPMRAPRIIPAITGPVRTPDWCVWTGCGRYWSPEEKQVIRERYLTDGAKACAALLPDRTIGAIRVQAKKMDLTKQQKGPAQDSTELIDAAIRRHYREPQPMGAMAALAKRVGRTRQWIHIRAAALGCAPLTRSCAIWTPEEDELLERHATLRVDSIARIFRRHGYHRTAAAIGERLYRRGVDRSDPDTWTANDLALCMGVDGHRVLRWIDRCGLPAVRDREGDPATRGNRWRIRRADLRAWMIKSAEWDHRRVPREWLVDILSTP